MITTRVMFLGYEIFSGNCSDVLDWVRDILKQPGFHTLATMNPEMVVYGKSDLEFGRYLQAADLRVADGVGLVAGVWFRSRQWIQRVTGVDLILNLFQQSPYYTYYLVGGEPRVLDQMLLYIKNNHSQVRVLGSHHGFMDPEKKESVIHDICQAKPDIVLVAMGVPRQERFLFALKQRASYGLGIGVGGAFDVISGTKKRAPVIFQKIGLEWLYRGLSEPQRLLRWAFMPRFIKMIFFN